MTTHEFLDTLMRERNTLEDGVVALVEKFESETGLKIDTIHIIRKNFGPEDGEIIKKVEFKINL